MTSTNADPQGTWSWPEDIRPQNGIESDRRQRTAPGAYPEDKSGVPSLDFEAPEKAHSTDQPLPKRKERWASRTCRICFETVQPTFEPLSEHLPASLQGKQRPVYLSEDHELGRLICPCKCKGSSKYVHEGCLQQWRHSSPDYAKRNYWECPTCHYRYRLERMRWGRWISSGVTQVSLTVLIFITTLFFLGFVADPIINFYSDPWAIFSSRPLENLRSRKYAIIEEDATTWPEHFLRGLASMGVLGFLQYLLTLSPWHWLRWNVRSGGVGSGRGATGRHRVQNISWIVIAIGVAVFLWVRDFLLVRASIITDQDRTCTRACVIGRGAPWKWQARKSSTLAMIMTMTRDDDPSTCVSSRILAIMV